jgi:hypothetical protein
MSKFTQEQVQAIFRAITEIDSVFVEQFAKAAITNSAEVHGDMFAEVEDGISPPNLDNIRGSAVGFVADLLAEFGDLVSDKINNIKCSKVTRLDISINFDQ